MRTVLVLCLSSLWCVAALQCVATVESARRVRVPSRTSHLLATQPRPSHVDASSAAAEVDASSAAAQVALELASLEQTPLSQPVQLELHVSSPALLLNHMAERYTSTSRILMEFVDNAFDDAEALYETQGINGETGAETESETSTESETESETAESETAGYSRPVFIDVSVSRSERTVRILDNCRGMTPETLARVVMRVGESEKRGASFVNGQFGFGMQVRVCTHVRSSTNPSLFVRAAAVKRPSGFGMQSLNT